MEDASERAFSDSTADFDFIMDELLSGDYLLEAPDYSDLLNQSTSASHNPFSPSPVVPLLEFDNQEDEERSEKDGNFSWLIRPRCPIVPLKDRLSHALRIIKESQRDSDVLAQIWVPTRRGERRFLTTCGQPFWLDANSQSLANYRAVSVNYQFCAEENSNEIAGLPGRVFLGKVPEWTPDVRYFSSDEFARVGDAQRYNVCGTVALPIFERDGRSCIGVVEVVLTTQKINYSSDLENICNALQAVDLRTSNAVSVPRTKVSNSSYQAALPEIRQVLKTVCEAHSLPLGQTWITCIDQGKRGSRHSDENYKECISTIDDACYVNDLSMLRFHEACSEHHLFRGQGVVGKAFTTNQPCFSPNVTSFTKTEYPLSHHAKLFHLRGAVAIRLRSVHTGKADFVLELFLPLNCIKSEEQKMMLNSLSITVQKVCKSLRVVDAKELEDEAMLEIDESYPSDLLFDESEGNITSGCSPSVGISREGEASNTNMHSSISLECSKQETEEFGVVTNFDTLSEFEWPKGSIFLEFKQQECSRNKKDTTPGGVKVSSAKATKNRRAKFEKTVSLQVLRQYFAGSLKDAAKSIGVCPTTLKRICRQHGITRWPSRKIKKVSHSLKKLQLVIDSVQGSEGTFRFSSAYENFTKTSNPDEKLPGSYTISTVNQNDHPKSSNTLQQQECKFSSHTSSSNSLSSSSCSQSSSSRLVCCSGAKESTDASQPAIKHGVTRLERENSEIDLHLSSQQQSCHKALRRHSSLENLSQLKKKISGGFKVKAIYGEEKVRFKLQPTWGFRELKKETMNRFNISDGCSVGLKYLDDDSEWVLLTCDEDLQECMDVHKSSNTDTIKISVHLQRENGKSGKFG